MAHRARFVEVVVRYCIALVLLANALAPTVIPAKARSAQPADGGGSSADFRRKGRDWERNGPP